MREFIRGLPKAELHLHIEGTLEPEMMLELAERNHVELPYATVDDARRAYSFADLQSFLDLYYLGAGVLQQEQDFHDLTWAYCQQAHNDGVRHAEIFFDPQTHTDRGVPLETVMAGLTSALARAERELGLTSQLICCFLRHLTAEAAMRTLEQALPFREQIIGVGLDSAEVGNPPARFREVFASARQAGFRTVAHAGEEGPPEYITEALDLLYAERIDHGVRCMEDPDLVERLRAGRIPLTVCPLSNVALRVFPVLAAHPLRRMLEAGLCVSIHSDDPAYFGGSIAANFEAVHEVLGFNRTELVQLARHSISAAWLEESRRDQLLGELDLIDTTGY